MTTFPGSPRLVKGGIVVIDTETAAVVRVIPLQYNLAAGGVEHTLVAGESRESINAGTARLAPCGGCSAAGAEIARAINGGLNR